MAEPTQPIRPTADMDYSSSVDGPSRREDLSTGAQSLPTTSHPPYDNSLGYENGYGYSYEPTYDGDETTSDHPVQPQEPKEPAHFAARSADAPQLALPVLEESVYYSEKSSDVPSTPTSMPDEPISTPPRIRSPMASESAHRDTEGANVPSTLFPMYSAAPRQIPHHHRTYTQTPPSWKSLKLSVQVSLHMDNIRLEVFEKMIAEEVERRFDARVALNQGARLHHGLGNGEMIDVSGNIIDESDTLRVIAREVEALQREMDIFQLIASFRRLHGSVVVCGSNNPIGSVRLSNNTPPIASITR
ncbi:hypothetical protein VE02_05058 [Pseudogymnoascus sp. 03VT05]|nr:hypothetical protein VE02_05058 [Pseudogymnoascus sp. 03VT05]